MRVGARMGRIVVRLLRRVALNPRSRVSLLIGGNATSIRLRCLAHPARKPGGEVFIIMGRILLEKLHGPCSKILGGSVFVCGDEIECTESVSNLPRERPGIYD